MISDDMTIAEASRLLSQEFEYAFDCTEPQLPSKWWSFQILGLTIYCYNFKWRQKAILGHDLHHLVTGYPFTLRGEMQVATWEFAAGRFPNIFANLFCLPLVAVGFLLFPKKIWKAYCLGKANYSLFDFKLTPSQSKLKLKDLRHKIRKEQPALVNWMLKLKFLMLVFLSFFEIAILFMIFGFGLYSLIVILGFL